MFKPRLLLSVTATFFFSLALCSTTQAAPRTFVSVTGNDANPCTFASPCRLFQRGHDAVDDGGEVVALTSGGYGSLTINKSVTISGVGVSAVAAPFSTEDAITIDTAGIKVTLRSIIVRGPGTGTSDGILVTKVSQLHIEGCVVSGFLNSGINVALTVSGSRIFLTDTISRDNGNGIYIQNSTGIVYAVIDNCRAERNTFHGFVASGNAKVVINRSVAAGNGNMGFDALNTTSGTTTIMICTDCVASDNENGFNVSGSAGANATIRVAHSSATNNATGFAQAGLGLFYTLGNNLVRDNTTVNTSGTIDIITLQ